MSHMDQVTLNPFYCETRNHFRLVLMKVNSLNRHFGVKCQRMEKKNSIRRVTSYDKLTR